MIYPVTIMPTRYSGTYEGGLWAAFNRYPEDIPRLSYGSDESCAAWWSEQRPYVAVGNTPQEALDNLRISLEQTRRL